MDKGVIIKLVKKEQITQQELFQFIVDYIEFKKGPTPTPEQLNKIYQLIQLGIFNLNEAIYNSAKELNLETNYLTDLNGNLIKIFVYDWQ